MEECAGHRVGRSSRKACHRRRLEGACHNMRVRMVVLAVILGFAAFRNLSNHLLKLTSAFFAALLLITLPGFATPAYALSSGCTALSGYFEATSGGYHGTYNASNFNAGERIAVTWTSGNSGSNYWITSGGSTVFGPSTGSGTYTVPSTTSNAIVIEVTNTGNFRIDWTCLAPLGAPTVTSVSPASGPIAGGTSVTLTGTGFSGATAVHFGATNATSFTVNSDSSITMTSPASSTGTVDITVTTASGTSVTSAADQFTYVPAVTATTAIASKALTQGRAPSAFTPVTGSGGTAPLAYTVSPTLPPGLNMSSAGSISGTPGTTLATTNFTVTVTDANAQTASALFALTVNSAVTATQAIPLMTLTANHTVTGFTPIIGGGGTGSLSYAITPGLPSGLSLNTSTGQISGTATSASSATTYVVAITDINGATASNTFILSVNASPTATQAIPSMTLTSNHAATPFMPVTGGGGTAPLTYSISPSLPSGLSFGTASGQISGTATSASSATTYTVIVTDANSATASNTFILSVNSPPTAAQVISSATLTSNHAATPFTPVTGAGGTAPLSYSISPSLPSGLSFSTASGQISGTATSASSATTYTVTVSDANSATASNTFNLTVTAPPTATQVISSATLTSGYAAASFTPVTGSGGTGTLSYSVSPSLPSGLTFNTGTGTVSGTPTSASVATTYTVAVTDTNGATASATFSLTVNGAVTATQAISSALLTSGHAVTSFTPVTGAGGTGALSYTVSPSLPSGLTFNSATGAVSGTPSVASGATSYSVTVTDTNGATASASFTLAVNSAVIATQSIASTSLTSGHAATSFTPVTGAGGTGALSYAVSPSLPSGLSFNTASGSISGTPTAASGTTSYTVTVTDTNGSTASASFDLTVNGAVTATQTVASTTLTSGYAATSFTPVTGSGGTGTLSYSVSPSMPSGLSFSTSSGAVSGTATSASAATSYTVTVTDTNGATASAAFTLTVNSAVTATQAVASTVLTSGHAATSFTPVTGSGGTGVLSYAVSPSLPSGLSLNTSSGNVSGTPASASSATTYTVTIRDANGATGSANFALTVNGAVTATQAVASTSLTSGHAATSFIPVTGSGGT
ncbi:MAG: hypothetical protein E6Q76_16095, partial [Rhizobium sp.]